MSGRSTRSVFVAAATSLLLPGLGHWYLGRFTAAIAFASTFAAVLPIGIVVGILVGVPHERIIWLVIAGAWVLRLVATLHAAWLAPRSESGRGRTHSFVGYAAFVIICSGLGYTGAAFMRASVIEPYKTAASSGAPNLLEGDHFVIAKLTARDRAARRGDLVTFAIPSGEGEIFVKRVLALPGETITFEQGTPRIEGETLTWVPCEGVLPAAPAQTTCHVEQTPEGLRYPIWQGEALEGTFATHVVPEGHIFVVGDHRSNSHDSRSFGPIPLASIEGRAVARWFPLDRAGSLIPEEHP